MTDLVRSWSGKLVLRASGDPAQRIIEGIVVPYDQVATVRDTPDGQVYRESIARGAMDGIEPTSVLLEYIANPGPRDYNHHDDARLIGRGVSADLTGPGAHMAFRVSKTAAGDEAYELARDGILTDLSINARGVSERRRPDGVVERTKIDVRRVAVVAGQGAYQGAQITAVRAASEGDMPNKDQAAATADDTDEQDAPATAPPETERRPNRTRVTVDVERAIADGITAELDRRAAAPPTDRARADAERGAVAGMGRAAGRGPAYVTRPEALYGPGSGRSFFRDAWIVSRGGHEDPEARGRVDRHYALLEDLDRQIQRTVGFDQASLARAGDVLSSEIPGAYPNEYLPGLIVNRVLKERPMGGFYQRFPLEDGRPRIYPVVTTSTSVAAQGAEGSNPAASDLATTGTTVTPVFYGGETKVSRQVLDGADPSTDVILQTDLNEAYMQASEAIIRAAVEAGSTASGVTLTAATPNIGLVGLELNYFQNVFLPAQRLFLPTTLYSSWLTQLDTTNRQLAPFYGPYNSGGQVTEAGLAGAVLNGVPVAMSWSSTAGAGAGVGGVAVTGRAADFAIFESNLVNFQFTQGAEAPAAIRIGLWAYLVVGLRRGSRKATGA